MKKKTMHCKEELNRGEKQRGEDKSKAEDRAHNQLQLWKTQEGKIMCAKYLVSSGSKREPSGETKKHRT